MRYILISGGIRAEVYKIEIEIFRILWRHLQKNFALKLRFYAKSQFRLRSNPGCDHSWFDTIPGLTMLLISTLSFGSHNYLGLGWLWTLTLGPRLGVNLQELWQWDVWKATTLWWLLDLYNYLEKFLCISTCLCFNADMSLTCI